MDYILDLWGEVPDTKFVPVPKEWVEAIDRERQRTGIAPVSLLKGREGIPYGLTSQEVSNWYSGKFKSAPEISLQRVLEMYRELPDYNPGQFPNSRIDSWQPQKIEKIEIDPDDLRRLRHYRDKSGILPGFILKNSDNIPSGLYASTISTWLNGATTKANPVYLDFVLKRCREILEEALDV